MLDPAASGSASAQGGGPPPILPGEEIYDQLMSKIEPELTSGHIHLLKEKYKNETPAQAKTRAERYNRAFSEYEKRCAQYEADWQGRLDLWNRSVAVSLERDDRSDDEKQMRDLASAISRT